MSSIPADAGLAVFLRKPEKGKVKTRLAATTGDDAALAIYKELISITLGQVTLLGIPTYLFYEGGIPEVETQIPGFTYLLQSPGDLGHKMADALTFVLNRHRKAVIIGSDCPYLNASILRESFSALAETDIVIGPALDGGYYLIGCKKMHPTLFDGIQWSTSNVLDQTRARIREANLTCTDLQPLEDIDTEEDWKKFRSS
jgi:rSAM/selenodomain-associated transferase 1